VRVVLDCDIFTRMRRLAAICFLIAIAVWAARAEDLAGKWVGQWSGSASGEIRFALQPSDGGNWNADLSFTYGEERIQTKVKSVSIDGSNLEIQYEFELSGMPMKCVLKGKAAGKTIEGTYESNTEGSAVDSGTFKVALAE